MARQQHDALLAAFLEATHKIDLRALRKQAASIGMPPPVNVEAHLEALATEALATTVLEVTPPQSPAPPFALRRANLRRLVSGV